MSCRTFLSLLFAFLLAFSQQEAMLHPYVHTADWQQKSSNEDKSSNHNDVCGKCVALADVGSAVGSQSHLFHIASGQFELLAAVQWSIVSQAFLPYNSRAPPNLA